MLQIDEKRARNLEDRWEYRVKYKNHRLIASADKIMSRTSDGPFDNHVLYQSLSGFPTGEQSRWKKRLLNASDSFLSLFVVAPLVISHWRGTWGYMDLFPRIFPGLNCMIFGAVIHLGLAILREPLHSRYNSKKTIESKSRTKSFKLYLLKKIYTYSFSIGCIMHWYEITFNLRRSFITNFSSRSRCMSRRGGWAVMEEYLGNLTSYLINQWIFFILSH